MNTLTIVTPSFNQAEFVAKMLESVSAQDFPVHEHLIYDAGSKDGTLDILREYVDKRAHARLEVGKDKSQSNAINLGFLAATGDVICWLNTDDWYQDDRVLADVMAEFDRDPDLDVLYGRGDFIDHQAKFLREAFINTDAASLPTKLLHSVGILQPALFMRRRVFEQVGPINEDLHFCFDYEYWVRAAKAGMNFRFFDRKICSATLHMNSKTMGQRVVSLGETTEMVRRQFGFAPLQWLERLADAELAGADGIVNITTEKGEAHVRRLNELFVEYNSKPGALSAIRDFPEQGEAFATQRHLKSVLADKTLLVVTAFDSKFFTSGLTLLARLRESAACSYAVFVYDLGLGDSERAVLSQLENVWVLDFPVNDPTYFEGYFSHRTYGFKSYGLARAGALMPDGASVLWIDGGIAPIKDTAPILERIEQDDIFVVDHDDKGLWPFHNATFCSDACAVATGASNAELTAPHVRAGVIGFKLKGRYQALVDEAFRYSLDPAALTGPKHLEPTEVVPRKVGEEFRRVLADPAYRDSLKQEDIRRLFGYLGHRHDQTIVSLLIARHGAPVLSARAYCIADDISSAVSKQNWVGQAGLQSGQRREVDPFYKRSPAMLMQHRGTYVNTQGLAFRNATDAVAIVMGNGPSLKGFDFERLKNFDVFGMNAAYRYWDRINWYPQYYACLDTVLGVSHRDEIKRLIEKADTYGIRQFLLRDNLIQMLNLTRNAERVINFDVVAAGAESMSAPIISTGSHTTAWASWLGYKKVCLLGIDANYVEIIDGAKRGKGTELEIVGSVQSNPNYFFDDYQQVGDKYNVPNPGRPVHLDSWREVAERLKATGTAVWNGNPNSKVDAFPFCDFQTLETEGLMVEIEPEGLTEAVERPRSAHAEVDETGVVAKLLADRKGAGHVMLDVGAHFGTSARYFDALGWTIHCFEPDPKNREKLVKRFKYKPNVTIDIRAVSDKPATGVAFFTSEESTGISGLHSFRETHAETGRVDVTTVELVARDRGITHVDFLKIDVEGFDFSVLKGVPWETLKPDVIEAEFEDAKTLKMGHTYVALCDYLVDRGYTVYLSEWHPIIRYGIPHDWRRVTRYPGEAMAPDAWGNLLAFLHDPGIGAVRAAFDACLKFRDPTPDEKARDEAATVEIAGPAPDAPTTTSGAPIEGFGAAPDGASPQIVVTGSAPTPAYGGIPHMVVVGDGVAPQTGAATFVVDLDLTETTLNRLGGTGTPSHLRRILVEQNRGSPDDRIVELTRVGSLIGWPGREMLPPAGAALLWARAMGYSRVALDNLSQSEIGVEGSSRRAAFDALLSRLEAGGLKIRRSC